jgi:hypothetical protein
MEALNFVFDECDSVHHSSTNFLDPENRFVYLQRDHEQSPVRHYFYYRLSENRAAVVGDVEPRSEIANAVVRCSVHA